MSKYVKVGLYILISINVSMAIYLSFFPLEMTQEVLNGPSLKFPFGTDSLGRDLLIRCLQAGGMSFLIGFVACAFSVLIGVSAGLFSGWYGGWFDLVVQRIVEIFTVLPSFVFVTLIVSLTSLFLPGIKLGFLSSIILFGCCIGFTHWVGIARISRAITLNEKDKEYVLAAKLFGISDLKIVFQQIFPNLSQTLFISTMNHLGQYLLFEGFLSFVGLGVQPPQISWGGILQEGWRNISVYPHLILIPGVWIAGHMYLLHFCYEPNFGKTGETLLR